MATSQNGWPVQFNDDSIDRTPILGQRFPNGFLKGNVYEAFVWLFTQLNNRVERVALGTPADDWGWYVKKIEGSTTYSNHASGTAGDYNASRHPMGVRNTYSAAQRAEIHRILHEADGVFRWGGDYVNRPDDMHFEINVSSDKVADFVKTIRPKEEWKMSIALNGYSLPKLEQGDDDDRMAGPHYVTRAQLLLNYTIGAGLTVDGVYGPATTAAVKKLPTASDGKTVALAEWTVLYGLSHTAT